jgi:hypothetical protein
MHHEIVPEGGLSLLAYMMWEDCAGMQIFVDGFADLRVHNLRENVRLFVVTCQSLFVLGSCIMSVIRF